MKLFRREVRELAAYHLDQPRCRIKLDQNESPYDLPALIKRRIFTRLKKTPLNRYPSPYAGRLARQLGRLNRWPAAGVVVANGSNVLTQALVAATAVRSRLVLPDPTFSLYESYGRLFGNKIERVPLRADFSLDVASFVRKVRKVRPVLIFLANPNAPTGRLLPLPAVEQIVRATDGLVVVDEAYYPFSGASIVPKLKRYKNLVVLRTFSKAFSLGGARLGYLLAAPSLAGQIQKVLPPFSVSAVTALIAETVLADVSFVRRLVREIVRERERVYRALVALDGITVYPSQANFILFRSPRALKIYRRLVSKGILIRNVSNGRRLKNCLRVTIGTPAENSRFLAALQQVLS